jgi:CxxC motif-containing protein (DUF1111 family)
VTKTFRNLGSAFALVWAASTIYSTTAIGQTGITEAPTGFDNLTNGFVTQAQFDAARVIFEEREEIDEGLGPLYNADSCLACHANAVTGAISQVTELRAGHFNGSIFVDQAGGSLINDRAIDASIQERVLGTSEVRTFRTSLSVLGDGFVEAIANSTLTAIQQGQSLTVRGTLIAVPVLEANNATRFGRFGWKNQHASLVSFAADAYLNEMGITSPLQPVENTSNGNSIADFDEVPDPEDEDGADVEAFAVFMRASKAPPRDAAIAGTSDAIAGSQLFDAIGCGSCHVRNITTAAPGTVINGGALTVHPALGNKRIHPFSDFLMHDVGTGDGIVQNGGQATRNQLRTPPLWGLRSKGRLMHDGESLTRNDAILRHAGQATGVINNYRSLSTTDKNRLIAFLNSL